MADALAELAASVYGTDGMWTPLFQRRILEQPTPLELRLLEAEIDAIRRLQEAGDVESFGILGACLIDQHPEQTAVIRDYIHAQ